jgi:hypothetical protein
MFNLFKSKRNRWRDEASRLFDVYITSIQGLDSDEIGALLDAAKHIKMTWMRGAALNNDISPCRL